MIKKEMRMPLASIIIAIIEAKAGPRYETTTSYNRFSQMHIDADTETILPSPKQPHYINLQQGVNNSSGIVGSSTILIGIGVAVVLLILLSFVGYYLVRRFRNTENSVSVE